VSGSFRNDPLCQAVERAWKAGIVVVVAAGNNGRVNNGGNRGYATINSPGNSPFVITVGAVSTFDTTDRRQHKVTSYSSKGPSAIDRILKPDLVAPGNQIYAAQCVECPMTANYQNNRIWVTDYATIPAGAGNSNGHYLRLSGTSMAAPMVSGAAALLLQKNPNLTPDQVKARLMKTATKGSFVTKYNAVDAANGATYSISHDIFTVGAGLLNIEAALASNDTITSGKTAESPAVVYDRTTKKVRLVRNTSVVWGENIVWGESVVWGSGLVSGTTILWGESVVWGENTITGFSVVWGSSSPVAATGTALASTTSSPTIHGDR
jgi:serine protease AprX